jgi:betaine-aldehyde dehydrogenase
MFGVFWTNGQICSATSRLLVQDGVYEKVLQRIADGVKRIKMGDPLGHGTKIGPVVNERQFEQVYGIAQRAATSGLRSICGIGSPDVGVVPTSGFFIPPTVFADVPRDAELWCEEIFGPVLAACNFSTERDAVQAANSTEYGLGAAVFTGDDALWQRTSSSLRAGIIWRNCSQPCYSQTPW